MDAAQIALATLALQVVVAIITVTWTAGRVARGLEDRAQEQREKHERAVNENIEEINQRIGEVAAALREKITQVEFYVRDHYVSNDVMKSLMELFGQNMKLQFESLKTSIDEIKSRLNREDKP